ncbi:MAG: hypothetical protein K2G58_02100 [Alistipes sp.]|nr:hypothetical protein [Alistipes sp.]
MTSREFIAAEADNTGRIILYREGLFWKAYERSAFALCSQVRPLKPTRKTLKSLDGGDLISVGFPSASESATIGDLAVLERTDDRLTVATQRPVIEQEFRAWKASVPVKPQPVRSKAAPEDAAGTTDPASPDSTTGDLFATAATTAKDVAEQPVPVVLTLPKTERRSFLRRLLRWFAPASASAASTTSAERRIIDSLKDFNLADKTPMECMLFISELKNLLVNR